MFNACKEFAKKIITTYKRQEISFMKESAIKQTLQTKAQNVDIYKESLTNKNVASSYPIEIFFEVSNFCNMKCAMCLQFSDLVKYDSEHKEDAGILPLELMKKCFVGFEHALLLHPVGFGEPLVHPRFAEVVETAKKSRLFVEFFTNALRLKESIIRRLIKCQCDKIFVSFNGATRDTYQKIMQGGCFDTVVHNLETIKQLKKEYGSQKPTLAFNTIAMHPSFEELPKMVHLAAKTGVEFITMKTMNIYANNPDIHSWRRVYLPDRDDHILDKAFKVAENEGVHLDVSEFLSTKVQSKSDEKKLQEPDQILKQELKVVTPMCFQPFKTFYVKENGTVKTCCFAHTPVLGNLHEQSMEEIWHGEKYQKFREGVLQGYYPPDCNHCLKYNTRPKIDDTNNILNDIISNSS